MKNRISEVDAKSLYRRCVDLHRTGHLASAERLYVKILKDFPKNHEIIGNFATLQFQKGNHAKALQYMERALALAPDSPTLEYNVGKIFFEMGRHADAETHFRACLALSPNFGEAMHNLGVTLMLLGRYFEAIDYLQRTVELVPSPIEPLTSLGQIHIFLNDHVAAEEIFKEILKLDKNNFKALHNLGGLQYTNGKFLESIETYRSLLLMCPDHLMALSGLLFSQLTLCDWSDLTKRRVDFLNGLSNADGKSVETTPSPYTASLICDDAAVCHRVARVFNTPKASPTTHAPAKRRKVVREKINVAYLSADFREHATSYLIGDLIECHDRTAFEVTGISFGPNDASPMRQRMELAFDRFEDLTDISTLDIAKRLSDLSIDIAVDLQGFNQYNRMGIFSSRAVPVQVLYLGWPGTAGARFYDYLLADPIVAPKENFEHFSENIVWLPHCYQSNDRARKIGLETPSRKACDLPETGFVFCCFNNTFKILPEIFDVWMRLIQATPSSVLWILETSQSARENLRREANIRGVDPARLIFAPHVPNDQHLARLINADLVLDTIPYNAHTTASDALWMGVPIVTCTGWTFASRVATSLLHNVGLPELAVTNLADYESLALRLAAERSLIKALKAKLLAQRPTAPLFDTPQLTRDIETAYREMMLRFDGNLSPGFIDVRALSE